MVPETVGLVVVTKSNPCTRAYTLRRFAGLKTAFGSAVFRWTIVENGKYQSRFSSYTTTIIRYNESFTILKTYRPNDSVCRRRTNGESVKICCTINARRCNAIVFYTKKCYLRTPRDRTRNVRWRDIRDSQSPRKRTVKQPNEYPTVYLTLDLTHTLT